MPLSNGSDNIRRTKSGIATKKYFWQSRLESSFVQNGQFPFAKLNSQIFFNPSKRIVLANGELIPGTEGITPGPGVRLENRDLRFAVLRGVDLTSSRFDFANLTEAQKARFEAIFISAQGE